MNKNILLETNTESADSICEKINEEADSQSADILSMAEKEAERILNEARVEAEEKKNIILKDLDIELGKMKERAVSIVSLEKKRIFLEEKNNYAQDVFRSVKKMAEEFRSSPKYRDFLIKSILEGVRVIDKEELTVIYSYLDGKLFNDGFIKEIKSSCKEKYSKNISLELKVDEFQDKKHVGQDIGVIVRSKDGGLIFDNRFSARLKRVYNEVYMQLVKEAF